MEKRNINYTYMTNLWGNINYKQINNFDEWYMGDFGAAYYYQDWDKILRYFAGAGFQGIELMVFSVPSIQNAFGSMTNFKEFAYERGIRRITGMFSHHVGSQDKRNHPAIFAYEQQAIDALAECDGINLIVQPAGQYYGTGPLDEVAMAYVLDSPLNAFPVIGAANRAEMESSLGALNVKLTPQEVLYLELKTDTRK